MVETRSQLKRSQLKRKNTYNPPNIKENHKKFKNEGSRLKSKNNKKPNNVSRVLLYKCQGCNTIWDGNAQCMGGEPECGDLVELDFTDEDEDEDEEKINQ